MAIRRGHVGLRSRGRHARLFAKVLPKQLIGSFPSILSPGRFRCVLERYAQDLAGIIVEPLVQARAHAVSRCASAAAFASGGPDRHGLLLIFDEIFTGFARTGTLFACEPQVYPDIITLSKALTGGTMGLARRCHQHSIRGLSLRRSKPCADAWPTFMAIHSHVPPPMRPSIFCKRAAPSPSRAMEAALAHGLEPARDLLHVRDVRVKGASASSNSIASMISAL